MKAKKRFTQLDAIKSVRKPMPPASRVHTGKKYSKKDRKWQMPKDME